MSATLYSLMPASYATQPIPDPTMIESKCFMTQLQGVYPEEHFPKHSILLFQS